MQVTHEKDHITHAIIGGSQTIDFGISNSAEFFNILSTSLYTNQILAVVREVICNAWDAHIEAGISHIPIEITVNKDGFMVQDFGHGIPKDKIGEIYGVYGNSNKKDNGEVTGGFGLGCKSPFAYTDHFEVISCNSGVKTIYQISKSSAQVGGKPGITPVVSIPSDETGLTVKVSIEYCDVSEFYVDVLRIVRCGEIKARVNDILAGVIPFSKGINEFTLATRWLVSDAAKYDTVYIKYGHIIYPLPYNNEYTAEQVHAESIVKKLQKLGNTILEEFVLILHAPAHTISVTPSRESLSMQEHTVKTVKELLQKFTTHVDRNIEGCYVRALNQQVAMLDYKKEVSFRNLPKLIRSDINSVIHSVQQMANYIVSYGEPMSTAYRKTLLIRVIEHMIKDRSSKNGLLQSLLQEAKNCKLIEATSKWFIKRVYGTLLADLYAIDTSVDQDDVLVRYTKDKCYSSKYGTYSINQLGEVPIQDCILFVKNVVILTTIRKFDENRLITIAPHVNIKNCIIVYVSRKNKKLAAIRDMLRSRRDTKFVDMTIKYDWESTKKVTLQKKREGLPTLSNAAVKFGGSCDLSPLWKDSDGLKRISKPKFIVHINKSNILRFGQFSAAETEIIVRLYGDVAGVCRTTVQEEKYKKLGVPFVTDFLLAEIKKEFTYNKAIRRFLANSYSIVNNLTTLNNTSLEIIHVLLRFSELSKPLNLYTNLSEKENGLIKLFYQIRTNGQLLASYNGINEVNDIISAIKPSSAILLVANVISKTAWLEIVDIHELSNKLGSQSSKSKSLIDLLLKTFN
jgi:hypothetical protein